MRLSKSFWQTYKESPKDAEIDSHILLSRAGMIHKSAGGIYSYLPMAVRVLNKIKNIIREELDAIDSQEVTMSVVTPGDLWKETGRWEEQGKLMLKFSDRGERDLCISPTNEEAMTDIFRKTISSYKQLPVSLYQINTKFRDELRPRFGLMRGREFTMKDAYTFSLDKDCMDRLYDGFFKAYSNIFSRMGLEFITVEADGGSIAGKDQKTHEFQVVADAGEDIIVEAKEIGFAANIEKAKTYRPHLEFTPKAEVKDIETKGMSTCEDVAKLLGIPITQTLKTLVYTATYGEKEAHYMVMVLGDDALNEIKLKNFLNCDHLAIATEKVLEQFNIPKGYMSPYGISGISVLFDEAIDITKSYVVGANKADYHMSGFTPERDIEKYKVADLRLARMGDLAEDKKTPIKMRKGIEVGHIFQLGDKYSKSMGATVLDQNGKKAVPLMGCYGIGVTRTMQAAIEQNHDEHGIIWPAPIAPYQVYFGVIGKKEETKKLSDEIYQELTTSGLEVLFDDRGMGPGPMFKDADLLGLPVRIVLGERDYEKTKELEIKVRRTGDVFKVTKEEAAAKLKDLLKDL